MIDWQFHWLIDYIDWLIAYESHKDGFDHVLKEIMPKSEKKYKMMEF